MPTTAPLVFAEKMLKSDGAGRQAGVERLIDAKIGDEAVQAGGKGGNVRLLAEGGGQDGSLVGVQLLLGGEESGQEAGEEAGESPWPPCCRRPGRSPRAAGCAIWPPAPDQKR